MKKVNYLLVCKSNKEWDIFAPGQRNKKPVISIKANRCVAEKVKKSLDLLQGVPYNQEFDIIKN